MDRLPLTVLEEIVALCALSLYSGRSLCEPSAEFLRLAQVRPLHEAAVCCLHRYLDICSLEGFRRLSDHVKAASARGRHCKSLDVDPLRSLPSLPHWWCGGKGFKTANQALWRLKQTLPLLPNIHSLRIPACADHPLLLLSMPLPAGLKFLHVQLYSETLARQEMTYYNWITENQSRQPKDCEQLSCFVANAYTGADISTFFVPLMPASLRIFDCSTDLPLNDWQLGPALQGCVNLEVLSIPMPQLSNSTGVQSVLKPFAGRLKWLGLFVNSWSHVSPLTVTHDLADSLTNLRVLCCSWFLVDALDIQASKWPAMRHRCRKDLATERSPASTRRTILRFLVQNPPVKGDILSRVVYNVSLQCSCSGGTERDEEKGLTTLPRPNQLSARRLAEIIA